ncbi:hypothetical protein [Acinetobacter sp. MD2]|uniref:hypothetical protein n=1 Tax=Acinetobacter sp. MD2 TaxID=2600066 RepID=UPI002D1EDCB6|nr:hypothetical protein [Acinetobacter sp. MD2]MEB3766190.1 hypothetical protein [Acinetobacter sp. MD2]
MKSFYAHHISCSHDDDVFNIGLADDEFDPVDFVILSRFEEAGTSPDEQIGLLVNDSELEFKNAIVLIRCFDMQVVIELSTDVAEELEYDSIHIELTEQRDEVRQALKTLLRGSSIPLKFN